MARDLNLRQIEGFKALIETGTVSRAAELLNISQPAMSQLIAHLEFDTGLKLFDRVKGRLAPTDRAMRLYEEVGRIFSGVRQVQNAIDAIRREEQGGLAVGVISALSGPFIHGAMTAFLGTRRNVVCSIHTLGSQWIVERLIARRLDIGLVSGGIDNPYLTIEPFMEHALVCIMPTAHPLAKKDVVKPQDLHKIPFLTFHADTYIGHRIDETFAKHEVKPEIVLVSNVAPTLSEFVASGLGVALAHPLAVIGLEERLAVRRFEPEILFNFQLCRSVDGRNVEIVEAFAEELRATAAQVSRVMPREGRLVATHDFAE